MIGTSETGDMGDYIINLKVAGASDAASAVNKVTQSLSQASARTQQLARAQSQFQAELAKHRFGGQAGAGAGGGLAGRDENRMVRGVMQVMGLGRFGEIAEKFKIPLSFRGLSGIASVVGGGAIIAQQMRAAAERQKLMEQFSLSGGQLGGLKFAARASGRDVDELLSSWQSSGKSLNDWMRTAAPEIGKLVDQFNRLNLSIGEGTQRALVDLSNGWGQLKAIVLGGASKLLSGMAGWVVQGGRWGAAGVLGVAAPFSATAREMQTDIMAQALLKGESMNEGVTANLQQRLRIGLAKSAERKKLMAALAEKNLASMEDLKLAEMPEDARREYLQKQQQALVQRIRSPRTDALERQELIGRELAIGRTLSGMKPKDQVEAREERYRPRDALATIGGFTGRADYAIRSDLKTHTDLLRKIEGHLQRLEKSGAIL